MRLSNAVTIHGGLRMRVKALCLVVLAAVTELGLTGCSSPPPKVVITPTNGTLNFVNSASIAVNELFVSPTSSTTWGAARNGSPIGANGGTWSVTLDPGTYDARAEAIGALSTYYAYAMGWSLAAGQTYSLTATDASFTGSFQINNGNAVYALAEVYLSPTTNPSWGVNQLSSPIPVGGSRQITDVPASSWDLKCVHSNGASSTGTYTLGSLSLLTVVCS